MSHSGEGSVSHAVVVAVLCSVVSDSLRPHALQPARLLRPWDSSRQEYWSGLPFPSPGDLSDPGLEPKSLCLLGCRWILYYCTTWKAPLVSGGQIRGARGCMEVSSSTGLSKLWPPGQHWLTSGFYK